MAFILRRLVLSLLIPFVWKRWRDRRSHDAHSQPIGAGDAV